MGTPLSPKMDWSLMNPILAQSLNPILSNAILSGKPIQNYNLVNGVTIINHGLGRMMQGWFLTDQNAAASIYRSAPLNSSTLTLTSNAAVTVNIWCF